MITIDVFVDSAQNRFDTVVHDKQIPRGLRNDKTARMMESGTVVNGRYGRLLVSLEVGMSVY